MGTYTTVSGLLESLRISSLAEEENIRFAACFDNEEVPYFLISLFFTSVSVGLFLCKFYPLFIEGQISGW